MNQREFTLSLLFGAVAGLRALMAPAALAMAQQRRPHGSAHWLAAPPVERTLAAMAAGELLYDKLPIAASRLSPPLLSGRLLAGAMCGAASAQLDQRAGAVVGAAGALAAGYAGYHLRKRAGAATGVPDAIIGVAEDAIAIGLATLAANMEIDDSEGYKRRRAA